MTKRSIVGFVAMVMAVTVCRAESFYLKEDKTGEVYGPFPIKDGGKVELGEATYTIVKKVTIKLTLPQKLKRTIIPKMDFRNAGMRSVIDFLRQASIDYSPPSEEKHKGVNLILLLKGQPEPKVTFQARELSLKDALEAVASVTELNLRVEGNVVYIEPRD